MAAATDQFVDLVLSWSRTRSGTTAVLRRREGGQGWEELGRTAAAEWKVQGLDPEQAVTFAAAEVLADGGLAAEEEWEVRTVVPLRDEGAPALPGAPAGFAAAQDGGNLNLRWDAPADTVTDHYELRVGDTWDDARLVADDVKGAPYSWAWWSSGDTTLHLRAVDRFGRRSASEASIDVAIAPLDTHVDALEDDAGGGGWTGTATHLEDDGAGGLQLEQLPAVFNDRTQPFNTYDVPCDARYWTEGTYVTDWLDAGALQRHRVEVDLGHATAIDAAIPFNQVMRRARRRRLDRDGNLLPLGHRGFAHRNTISGRPVEPVDVAVEVDLNLDGAGTVTGFKPYVPGTYEFWKIRMRVTLRGDGLRFAKLPRLVLRTRRFNHKDEGKLSLPGGAPQAVAFVAPFTAAPSVVGQVLNSTAQLRVTITSVTAAGFDVEVFDATDASVAADIAWNALGV